MTSSHNPLAQEKKTTSSSATLERKKFGTHRLVYELSVRPPGHLAMLHLADSSYTIVAPLMYVQTIEATLTGIEATSDHPLDKFLEEVQKICVSRNPVNSGMLMTIFAELVVDIEAYINAIRKPINGSHSMFSLAVEKIQLTDANTNLTVTKSSGDNISVARGNDELSLPPRFSRPGSGS